MNHTAFIAIVLILLILLCVLLSQGEAEMEDKPYWNQHFEHMQFSVAEFYESIRNSLIEKGIPGLTISEVLRREGGIFSANRKYLQISRKCIVIEVGALCFARSGFYISCRRGTRPTIGQRLFPSRRNMQEFLEKTFYPETYYTMDVEHLFKTMVQESIIHAVEEISSVKGNRNDFSVDE